MEKLIEKANILMEALPYIRRFYNKTFVIKYGGHAMVDQELKQGFAKDVILMKYIGVNTIIVHGGGPQIGQTLDQMGKESKFVQGMRVTDEETMDIVEMVLVGKVNKEIVGLINHCGGKAIGLSGKDGGLITAKKYSLNKTDNLSSPPEIIDLGRVGEVERIDPRAIKTIRKDFIPVIAPVAAGDEGTYNINADLVAGKLAGALKAEKLILMTDVEGVKDKEGKLVSTLNVDEAKKAIAEEVVSGGMVPKVNCCLDALKSGVGKTHVIDGRVSHALLLEIFTDVGIGTEITRNQQ
ncbi:MAG: acetylglutamate kinase [Deltaproteobacteria bacterium]|nr:MAG: acetylglutamate kinase [Deltaproteobacteria bacterium]